jgi:hypothetical protein
LYTAFFVGFSDGGGSQVDIFWIFAAAWEGDFAAVGAELGGSFGEDDFEITVRVLDKAYEDGGTFVESN